MPLIENEWTESNFVAGELCLDFSNTLSGRRKGELKDRLRDHLDLIGWLLKAEIFDEKDVARLIRATAADAGLAKELLINAKSLRESIYSIFDTIRLGNQLRPQDFEGIEQHCATVAPFRVIKEIDGELEWGWRADTDPIAKGLGSLAMSAADLLTTERRRYVSKCRADSCAWLFVDETKNHSRAWCDMAVCGNREKARKHAGKRATRTSSTKT